ncbi:MAG TPA: hypothetical protein VLB47_05005 [Solirubrobacteraceae bacterium]|nr:hypothetical protein [Solirubrobacteraceae bacterium]
MASPVSRLGWRRPPGARLAVLASVALCLALVPETARAAAAACAPGTPAALTLEGLPTRIAFGPEHRFSLAYDDHDWHVASPITIRTVNRGEVLFEDRTSDELGDLFVQLDVDDRSATVSATFEQYQQLIDAPLPGTPTPCRQTVARTITGYRDFRIIDRCDYPSRRPRRIVIACGDGNFGLRGLRWRHWNRGVAVARGNAYANDCAPDCARGHFESYRVAVRAYRPRKMGRGHYTYTRLRIRFVGAAPSGHSRLRTLRAREGLGDFWWM